MKKLNTFGKAITKIFEVFHWIGAAWTVPMRTAGRKRSERGKRHDGQIS